MNLPVSGFSWINGINRNDLEPQALKIFSISEKKAFFYGYTNKYVLVWIVPAILLVLLKLSRLDTRALGDMQAWIFVGLGLSVFFGLVYLLRRKDQKHFGQLQIVNKGREIVVTSNGLAISSGEAIRGEVNSRKTFDNGLRAALRKTGCDYFFIPFKMIESATAQGHFFVIVPRDPSQRRLEVTLGDPRHDSTMNQELCVLLSQYVKINDGT